MVNCYDNQPTNELLDTIASISFIPYILQPTRITSHSEPLIDNIFLKIISHKAISGKTTATISDHLSQFLLAPNVLPKVKIKSKNPKSKVIPKIKY